MQLRATLRLDPDAAQRLVERLSRDRLVQVAYLYGSGVRQRLRFDSDLDIGVASSLDPLSPVRTRRVAQQIVEVTRHAASSNHRSAKPSSVESPMHECGCG